MNALLQPRYGTKRTELVPYEYTCDVCGGGVLPEEATDTLITLGCCEEHVSKRLTQLVAIEKKFKQVIDDRERLYETVRDIAAVELTGPLNNPDKLLAAIRLKAELANNAVRMA
jgi:hypothetical protein